ncbi:uncharacterized protein C3orf20-like [Dipodomys merriami]|uniref:uncharacterized protein C3orf20-like n=1 Tax=Dipodomys merriami TaxID=94247 RepID=UPI00384EE78B
MEGSHKATSDTASIYFFDQLKPKTKKWKKEIYEDQFSHLTENYGHKKKKSKEQKLTRVGTVALIEEKDKSHSLGFSESPRVLSFSPSPKLSKMYLQKNLLKEYKLTAPEILYELGKTLQKYAEYQMTFPVGIENLMNYSWQDFTEDTTLTTLEQDKALHGDSSSSTIIDSNNFKISNNPKELHKENHLVKAKKGLHVVPSKPLGKMSFVRNSQSSQMCQESNFSAVIHFSLSSKICLENGWIFNHPYSKWEILQWKTLLSAAVKRLQVAIIQMKIIAMMFNQNGGMVISRKGHIMREWMWPSKGKLEDPIEVGVNNFITVKISGRFAITLVYKWHPKSLKLSLAPVKHKFLPLCLADMPTGSADQLITSTIDSSMDISPMHDFVTSINLRMLQKKAKHIFSHWLNHYRFSLGMESINICQTPELPQKVTIKQKVSLTTAPLKQDINESSKHKEYLQCQYTFQPLKNVFKLSPPCGIQRALAINQTSRFSLPSDRKDSCFGSLLICPVVLRQTLCGKEEDTCRCSPYSIPEVTDLEYDNLINNQLASTDQIIIVYVFSAKEKDKHIEEVTKVYRELNRSRTMPCIQSHLDPFRLLKYNILSASKVTGSDRPLLVQRHNITPGIFLMYIQGKLVFANFIFNGYSTSAKDLQKQIVKTKNDYHMGYFLPKDYRIGA